MLRRSIRFLSMKYWELDMKEAEIQFATDHNWYADFVILYSYFHMNQAISYCIISLNVYDSG